MYYSNLSSGNQFLPALTRHPVFVAASGRIYLHKKLLDSVGRYIERERERVRPGQARLARAGEAQGTRYPSALVRRRSTPTARDVSIFPFIAEMKIYVLLAFHTKEALSMQRGRI